MGGEQSRRLQSRRSFCYCGCGEVRSASPGRAPQHPRGFADNLADDDRIEVQIVQQPMTGLDQRGVELQSARQQPPHDLQRPTSRWFLKGCATEAFSGRGRDRGVDAASTGAASQGLARKTPGPIEIEIAHKTVREQRLRMDRDAKHESGADRREQAGERVAARIERNAGRTFEGRGDAGHPVSGPTSIRRSVSCEEPAPTPLENRTGAVTWRASSSFRSVSASSA